MRALRLVRMLGLRTAQHCQQRGVQAVVAGKDRAKQYGLGKMLVKAGALSVLLGGNGLFAKSAWSWACAQADMRVSSSPLRQAQGTAMQGSVNQAVIATKRANATTVPQIYTNMI